MNKTINKNLIFGLAMFVLAVLVIPLQTNAYYVVNNNGVEYGDEDYDYNPYPPEVDPYQPDYEFSNYDYDGNDEDQLNARPAISSIDPQVANKNSNAINVTIIGSNFNTDSIVKCDGANLPTRYETSRKLIAQIPASKLDTNGSYEIKVFNDNSNKSSNSATFVVRDRLVTSATIAGTTGASGASTSSGNTTSTVKKTTTTKSSTATATNKSSTVKDNNSKNSGSELAGNAIFGASGFFPSNILQWIIFAILILLAVILWRKLWVTDEEKKAPLKHA